MSAIVGCFSQCKQNRSSIAVERMLSALSHRYCDGSNLRETGPISLGYGAFTTTKEEKDVISPFSLGTCTIVLDGRIDNRKELMKSFELDNYRDRVISDHELVLRAYQKWNKGCLERIYGDFSFAIWDGNRLFCGRDRFGVKPFTYFYSKDFFAFASELKALLKLDFVNPVIDEELLSYHFVSDLQVTEQCRTIYKHIKRLPPAHGMIIDGNGIKLFQYWHLDESRTVRFPNENDYYEGFLELLNLSTVDRMRSFGNVGTALSGGLDSSSITCLARDYYRGEGRRLHTFSCLFNNALESNEKEWIDSVVDQGDIIPHFLYPEMESPMFDIETMLWLNEGPFYGGNYYLQRHMYNKAHGQGIRVFLDGEDGDGTVSHGYDHLVQMAQNGNWDIFFNEADSISKNFGREIYYYSRANLYDKYANPYLKSLLAKKKYIKALYNIQKIHKLTNASRKKLVSNLNLQKMNNAGIFTFPLLREETLEKYSIIERLDELYAKYEEKHYPISDNALHYDGIVSSGSSYILEQIDRVSSFYGIEVRHPFFDHRLAEYCLAIPSRLKLRNGYTRFHFREAMRGILPETIRMRGGKGDLEHQAIYSFRKFCEKEISENILSIPADDPIVDKKEAKKTVSAYLDEKDDSKLMEAWTLATYGIWRSKLASRS